MNILKVVGNTEWGADRKVMLRLYRSLIMSKLDYGCIVYGSARCLTYRCWSRPFFLCDTRQLLVCFFYKIISDADDNSK